MIQNLGRADPNNYYKMPPVGITETRARVGMVVSTQYTSRCGNKECWFVGHAATSQDAQLLLDGHACPTLPARNELPTGYSTMEKLWDELDDATYAIMTETSCNSADVSLMGAPLRGYARGLAFALSMMSHPHFRTVTEISREAYRRYKIRIKEAPFEPTPGYRYNPVPPTPPPGQSQVFHGRTIESKPAPARKAGARRPTREEMGPLAKVDLKPISTQQAQQIKTAYIGGMFTAEELATIYKVNIETINFLVKQ